MSTTYTTYTPGAVQRDLDKTTGRPRRPIQATPTVTHEHIAEKAYFLWEQRGCPDGSAEKDWFDAEQQFRK